jgi:signal transduction histidine kinase
MLTSAESVLSQIDNPSPQGSVETLLPTIRESADIIRRQVMRCRKITDQFLRFSRGIPPSIEPLDLRDVVTSVVSLVNPTAQEARATIQIQGESSVPAVKANTEVVQHVILNLLVNAVQSLDDQGGTITVRFLINGDVRIQVTDTGCGIALEARKHLFEPFRSRKPQGTGLGLFLSRSFMRRFGGDVRLVESHAEGGSCFEIIFPQAVVEGS